MFYGTNDEVIKTMNAQLPAIYQAILIGNLSDQSANPVTTEEVKGATHRLPLISAAPAAKTWLDGLRKRLDSAGILRMMSLPLAAAWQFAQRFTVTGGYRSALPVERGEYSPDVCDFAPIWRKAWSPSDRIAQNC